MITKGNRATKDCKGVLKKLAPFKDTEVYIIRTTLLFQKDLLIIIVG